MRGSWQDRRGFTLIEVLLVVVVVGLLATIVIPRLMGAGREAKEANLRSTLQQLRSSIALFRSHTGAYPARLSDLQAPPGVPPATGLDDAGAPVILNSADYQGPYMAPNRPTIPFNVITGGNMEGTDWIYTTSPPRVGAVHAAPGPAADGSDYSTW
ncbi:MAG: type II secretion system protein [Armatimonadota bacterium]